MIEDKLDELIALQKETLEAIKAQSGVSGGVGPAPAATTRKSRGAAAKEAPAPAKEEAPAPAAATKEPAAKGPTVNDLKKFVKDERTRLKDVSDEAHKKHKEESAKILKKYGLTDFTSIPEDKVEAILADFKALNVEQPKDGLSDDLEDDNDGLD